MCRKLLSVSVAYSVAYYENGQKYSRGFGFAFDGTKLTESVSGSLSHGTVSYTRTVQEVVNTLRRMRDIYVQNTLCGPWHYPAAPMPSIPSGRITVSAQWSSGPNQYETLWGHGQFSCSIRDTEEANKPTSNDFRSPFAHMVHTYLTIGDESVLSMLADYLRDRTGEQV